MLPTQLSVKYVLPGRATTPRLPDTIATPFEPAHVPTVEPVSHQNMTGAQPGKRQWPKIAGALMVVFALALGGLLLARWQSLFGNRRNGGDTGASGDAGNATSQRSLAYWLTVERIRDGRPDQQFLSSGQETFGSGDRFRLNVSSPQSGYLYVF